MTRAVYFRCHGGIGVSAIKVVTGLLYATVEVSPIGYVTFEILVIVFISVAYGEKMK